MERNGGYSNSLGPEFTDQGQEQRILNLELASQVVNKLRQGGLFITTVESCTGGGLANAITNISGASEIIKGAFVTYSNEQKIALGVPREIIDQYTVYSTQTAEAMARTGLKASAKADIAVGITGSISRIDPANPNSVPGTIYVAAVSHDASLTQVLKFTSGERWEIKEQVIGEALKMVLSILNSANNGPHDQENLTN